MSHVSAAAILGAGSKSRLPDDALLDQFATIFYRGLHLCPTTAIFAGVCHLGNAALTAYYGKGPLWPLPERASRLVLAGSLALGIVPYTLTLIVPLEEKLLRRKTLEKGGETMLALRKWNRLNYVRALIPVMSVVAGWTLWW